MKRITLNDNERFKLKPNNDNDIAPYKGEHDKHTRAETDAHFMMDTLGVQDSQFREFYLKVAYRIDETVWRQVLTTCKEKGKYPSRLFSTLIKRELDKSSKDNQSSHVE